MAAKPIPDGYHTVTPYLTITDAPHLIEFLQQAFAAEELHRTTHADGTIMNAEIKIGDSVVMVSEARGEWQPMPGAIYLYVKDTDETYQRALQAGATSLMEPGDQFYGDRSAGVKDRCGNHWWIATHQEDVSPEELARRIEALAKHPKD
jgi:PhnB protein